MPITGYQIQKKLYQGKNCAVFRAKREGEDPTCILKVLDKKAAKNLDAIKEIKQEYALLQRIGSINVIKALSWFDDSHYSAIELEDIKGKSLKEEMNGEPLPIEQFGVLAVAMASGLADIHQRSIIHKDINPGNIIWEPQSGSVKIIDFNLASTSNVKVSHLGNPETLKGTLPYVSPEQTGRMNRRVDQRTDLYSLGATFYEMLTGQTPFPLRDPMEIIYAHLARAPEPPHKVNEAVPEILSRIVSKLLAKSPEERYQSAEGLIHDLKKALSSEQTDFALGEKDFSGELQIPERLYGREMEIGQLLSSYRQICKGANEMIMVAGYSGTGKTALVNEIHKPITKNRGYFIGGKFDQLQRAIPYSAFVQALNQFCQLILMEKEDVLALWRERILKAVGNLGRVLTDIIPQLESVIGKQAEVEDVGGEDAKKRFNYVFQRFIQTVSTEEHPLVIFIDDLQWADLASLSLLQVLMEDSRNHYLFFIGAYRDNEVTPAHPLMTTIEDIKKQKILIHTISVKNLSWENVSEWLDDTLSTGDGHDREAIKLLADLIYKKTQGNAFFTIQFLQNLYHENLLSFDFTKAAWTWDIDKIKKQDITDNVVDLLVKRIRTLPGDSQDTLKLAACIGNRYDLHALSIVSGIEVEELESHQESVLAEQMVYPKGAGVYAFIHDRIHQAAYSMISENAKKPLHVKIGRMLLQDFEISGKNIDTAEDENPLFEIVNHLNIGKELIDDKAEQLHLARLNLVAGQNAKMSAAYKPAADYIHTVIDLLPQDAVETQYALTLDAYNEAVQTAYLMLDYEEMETYAAKVIGFSRNVSDQSTAHAYRMMSFMAQNKPLDAIETLLNLCDTLGVEIPRNPDSDQFSAIMGETHALLEANGIGALKGLPAMTDPQKQVLIRLFYIGAVAFIFTGHKLMPIVVAKLVKVLLEYGLCPEAPYVFAFYGIIRLAFGDISAAYQLGQTTIDLLDRGIANEAIRGRSVAFVCIYMLGQKEHLKDVYKVMMDHYPVSLSVGDLEYATYMLTNSIMCVSRTDMELVAVGEKARSNLEAVNQLKQQILTPPLSIEIGYNDALLGKTANPTVLELDHDTIYGGMIESMATLWNWQINVKNTVLAILFEDYENMLKHVADGEENGKTLNAPMTYLFSDINFYFPLAFLQKSGRTEFSGEKARLLEEARKRMDTIKMWADFGPVNYLHKHYILQAELNRVSGDGKAAEAFYEKAIETAYQNDYYNETALANELAARFYLENGQQKLAALHLMEARNFYRKWGAVAKVKYLDDNYPKYLSIQFPGSMHASGSITSSDAICDLLDIKSIMKASQTLSGEVQLKGLLEKMVQLLIENAGAQHCVFMESERDQLLVQAEGSTEGISGILQDLPVEESKKTPLAVINYVAHSKETLAFDNISKDTTYSTDPYIQKHQPKSVVCFPILSKGKLSAIIYLENNLVEGAFTPARMEILNMLSSQIAISIENSRFYRRLEESEKNYRSLFENALEGIFQVTPQGRIMSANPSMAQIMGYDSAPEMIADISDLRKSFFAHPEDVDAMTRILVDEGSLSSFETKMRRRNGDEFWGAVSSRAVQNLDDEVIYYEGSVVDISERIERENAERQREAAEIANKTKSEFLASMSHEIRTPMNAILGMADLLWESPLNPQQKEYVRISQRSGQGLLDLINDILDLSKVEAGQLILEEADLDLVDVVEQACEVMAIKAHEKKLELVYRITPETPRHLIGDATRLRQILVNLVGNAVKFTQEGEIVLEVSCDKQAHGPEKKDGEKAPDDGKENLFFSVRDTGIGIPTEHQTQIFEQFTQADTSTTRQYGGTGLGLAICSRLVGMMGGRIWVESEPDKGSQFCFTATLGVPHEPKTGEKPLAAGFEGLRALVVDDNATNRLFLHETLSSWGMAVIVAESSEKCLEEMGVAEQKGIPFQLILLDGRMPGMDGFETAHQIRNRYGHLDHTMMLLTSDEMEKHFQRSTELGIAVNLVKPVKQGDLHDAIEIILGRAVPIEYELPKAQEEKLNPLQILLVEDNEDNQLLFTAFLKDTPYQVVIAENGKIGVEKYLSGRYDLVFMDLEMPVMDGYEAARMIRKHERENNLTSIPIIALTAHALIGKEKESLDAGCSSHMTKPFKKKELEDTIRIHAT